MKYFKDLVRIKVSLMVGLASFAGACLFSRRIEPEHYFALFCAMFLAFGCSALNQYQEQHRDAMMKRTKSRPLPGGHMLPPDVIKISVCLILLGLCFALLTDSAATLFLALFTVVGYNFVYTPAKVRTPFSVMIGSVTGALPPMLGFCAAGGSPLDIRIVAVTAVLYLWQTPHFALLAEKYADDYETAGFKTFRKVYGDDRSRLFINVWMTAYIAALFFVPLTGIYRNSSLFIIHIVMTTFFTVSIILSYKFRNLIFHYLNASAAVFFALITSDSLFKF